MTRSVWKGPFFQVKLLKRVQDWWKRTFRCAWTYGRAHCQLILSLGVLQCLSV